MFSLGDPVTISFAIESNSLPISVFAGRATYEPTSFALAIGGYQFGPADGSARLDVWDQDDFQFSINLASDIPAPGYWIEQVAFAFQDSGSPSGDTDIPLQVPLGVSTAFDMDLYTPFGYRFVTMASPTFEVVEMASVPVPALSLPFAASLFIALYSIAGATNCTH